MRTSLQLIRPQVPSYGSSEKPAYKNYCCYGYPVAAIAIAIQQLPFSQLFIIFRLSKPFLCSQLRFPSSMVLVCFCLWANR